MTAQPIQPIQPTETNTNDDNDNNNINFNSMAVNILRDIPRTLHTAFCAVPEFNSLHPLITGGAISTAEQLPTLNTEITTLSDVLSQETQLLRNSFEYGVTDFTGFAQNYLDLITFIAELTSDQVLNNAITDINGYMERTGMATGIDGLEAETIQNALRSLNELSQTRLTPNSLRLYVSQYPEDFNDLITTLTMARNAPNLPSDIRSSYLQNIQESADNLLQSKEALIWYIRDIQIDTDINRFLVTPFQNLETILAQTQPIPTPLDIIKATTGIENFKLNDIMALLESPRHDEVEEGLSRFQAVIATIIDLPDHISAYINGLNDIQEKITTELTRID